MTGKSIAVPGLLVLCLGLVCADASAQVQVSARLDAEEVAVGHTVRLTVSVSGADREITPPRFPSLPGVDAYGAGQSQRFSFVNGQSRAEYSWSWSLVPRREGVVEIPAITVSVDGKDYSTLPRRLVVIAARSQPPSSAVPDDRTGDSEVPDAFVTMRVSVEEGFTPLTVTPQLSAVMSPAQAPGLGFSRKGSSNWPISRMPKRTVHRSTTRRPSRERTVSS